MGQHKFDIDALGGALGSLPVALTIVDLSQPDHPLIFTNEIFREMTGYGDEVIGTNCRFMQSDFTNDDARAEIRAALGEGRPCQVLLKNRKRDGTMFHNLLQIGTLARHHSVPPLALGTQYDLGEADPDVADVREISGLSAQAIALRNLGMSAAIMRRRVVFESALRMADSWCILRDTVSRYETQIL